MKTFRVIGLMSGTSLDGLDVADVTFVSQPDGFWKFTLNHSAIYSYGSELLARLKTAHQIPAQDLVQLSTDLGRLYAEWVNRFIDEHLVDKSEVDFIASHGQTIFHQPEKGFTLQIGNGPELSVLTQLPSVVDFRTKDVALGGNGAPLIPIADHLLFSKYAEAFLNLGGFSNVSYRQNKEVLSNDICPVNILINELMRSVGEEFDAYGNYGKGGAINQKLFDELNGLTFYAQSGPKSLGWEWVEAEILPLLEQETDLKSKIRTLYEHIAFQIGKVLNNIGAKSTLVTGGGALNSFLIERIRGYYRGVLIVPEKEIIDFKEAIGFAFLGLLRWNDEINVLSSVTGSKCDSSSGIILMP
ncbi:anhydro-N-acetylmuramic acid kinase [Brumimicrobium sp.]|uniref:anhydro-N-acetylmuramic acid kinase n=1 Tax=Brumimicrobium sp. TaxID=2029867 RepID=UPI003A946980